MAAINIARYNSLNIPKMAIKKVLFCDTCFIVDSIKLKSNCFKIREELQKNKVSLGYNTNVHSELIKVTRFKMIEQTIISLPNNSKYKKFKELYDRYNNPTENQKKLTQERLIKEVLKTDFRFVQNILGASGEHLKDEVDAALEGISYFGSLKGMKASWDDVYPLIGATCLNSSDAMILNMVVNNDNFEGVQPLFDVGIMQPC